MALAQLLANLSTSSCCGAQAVWSSCFPHVFTRLAQQQTGGGGGYPGRGRRDA